MRKISSILLILALLGWGIMVLIMGWDDYYAWYRHHKFLFYSIDAIVLLLWIVIFSNDSNKPEE